MKQSKLFTKTTKQISKEEASVNAQLLLRGGFIDKLMAGVYTILPLGLRVLNKIENIIRQEMNAVDGQEILMPALSPKENWEATGRWTALDVLFKLEGAGDKQYALGASHEEVVTPLAQKFNTSYKDFPFSIYQLQTKFRNEPRAKSGILRGREFRMKDMYSFHTTQADLDAYYEKVTGAYKKVYDRCGLGDKTYLTFALGGTFSKYSHEFQTITPSGEDDIYVCEKCQMAVNKEALADCKNSCPDCGNKNLVEKKAIEVGNIFKLGTKYSGAFKYNFMSEAGKQEPVLMGCYGIGPTRVLGAIVEACHDDKGIVWPASVAPFEYHLICLGDDETVKAEADKLYEKLTAAGKEVLYDDRPDTGAGAKFADADLIGLPTRLVISAKTLKENAVEVKNRNEEKAELKLPSSLP